MWNRIIKKPFRTLSYLLVFSLISWVIFLGCINYVFIPKVLIPKIKNFVDSKSNHLIKLEIEKIFFHPFKGFQIRGLILKDLNKNNLIILASENLDIDLAFRSIYERKIIIRDFEMQGTKIKISRDREGRWNFSSLGSLKIFENQNLGKSKFLIDQISVHECQLNIEDLFQAHNQINRQFLNVNINLSKSKNGGLFLQLRKENINGEKLLSNIYYNPQEQKIKGFLKFKTNILSAYWKYYLDEFFQPWKLNSEEAEIKTKFVFERDKTEINGDFRFKNIHLSNKIIKITGRSLKFENFQYSHKTGGQSSGTSLLEIEEGEIDINRKIIIKNAEIKGSVNNQSLIINKLHGEVYKVGLDVKVEYWMTHEEKIKIEGFWGPWSMSMDSFLEENRNRKFVFNGRYKNTYLNIDGYYQSGGSFFTKIKSYGMIDLSDFVSSDSQKGKNISGCLEYLLNFEGDLIKKETISGDITATVSQFVVAGNKPIDTYVKGKIEGSKIKGQIEKIWNRNFDYEVNLDFEEKRVGMLFFVEKAKKEYQSIKAEADIAIKYEMNVKDLMMSHFIFLPKIILNNAKISLGEREIIKNGTVELRMNGNIFQIKNCEAVILNTNASLKGEMDIVSRALSLNGQIGLINIDLKINENELNKIRVKNTIKFKDSYLDIMAIIKLQEEIESNIDVKSTVEIRDIFEIFKNIKLPLIDGTINLSGQIKLPFKKLEDASGDFSIDIKEISFYRICPLNLQINTIFKNGQIEGRITEREYCKGKINGGFYLDNEKYGFEINLQDAEINEIFKNNEELSTLSGKFIGNIALINKKFKADEWFGGGYIKIRKGYFWKTPFWESVKEGINSVKGNLGYDNLEKIEGNFRVEKNQIILKNIYCESKNLNLDITGTLNFNGEVDVDVNTSLFGRGIIRSLRRFANPISTGMNIMARPLKIKIQGKWPDYSQKATISSDNVINPWTLLKHPSKTKKYQLEELIKN